MANSKRSIFRSKTVQKYTQNREKSVLPRVVAPPVFVLCWIILTFLVVAGIVAWMGKVPLYTTGMGIILAQSTSSNQDNEATAIIPLPVSTASHLRAGLPIQVQVGQTGPLLTRTIDSIDSTVLSPDEVQQKYALRVSDPSNLLLVKLGTSISSSTYAGSIVQVQIQTDSQSLLSLFPVFNVLLKDK